MVVLVSQADVEWMLGHAAAWLPREGCGVLIGRRKADSLRISAVIGAANIAEGDRRRRYQISWDALFEAYRTAERSGQDVVGFFHSHPDGTDHPSRADQAEALMNHLYLILPLARDGIVAPQSSGRAPVGANRLDPSAVWGASRAWWFGEGGFRECSLLNADGGDGRRVRHQGPAAAAR
jgi:proteasome lid subunit RPN8/RPN11